MPCPHALADPEHHHPAEHLPTCWVTKGHSLHWVCVNYHTAWLAPGAWPLLCLLLGYVTGSQFPSFSFSANPTPPSWVPLNLSYMGGIPEQEGAASAPTYQSRECLLGGQRRKHSSACLSGQLHPRKDQSNREKITCDKTAMLDNKPPVFFSAGASHHGDPGGPNGCETHVQVSSGWVLLITVAGLSSRGWDKDPTMPQHASPRNDGDL